MTPQDPTFANYAVSVFILGLIGVAGLVAAVSTVYKNMVIAKAAKDPARTPPLAEEMAKVYATKPELQAMRAEWQARCAAQHSQESSMFAEIYTILRNDAKARAEWQQNVAQQLGGMESVLNLIKQKVFKS